MRILITGVTGFVGRFMVRFLRAEGIKNISGLDIRMPPDAGTDDVYRGVKLFKCDLMDKKEACAVIKKTRPDIIFHLAAQSVVSSSFDLQEETLRTNIISQLHLFQASLSCGIDPVIQIAGSSDEYGAIMKKEIPVTEENPFRPGSPYAVSKIAQDYLGFQYHRAYGLKVIRTRAFNHSGPERSDIFSTASFARQIAEIESGKAEKQEVKVGDLSVIRDFLDVRDVCRAYWIAVRKGVPGEVYNVCSGKGISISDILGILISFSKKKIKIIKDKARLRPSDNPVLIGDNRKLRKLGWKQEISIKESLLDLLNYWREIVLPDKSGNYKRIL